MSLASQFALDYPFIAEVAFDTAYVVCVLGTDAQEVALPGATTDTPLGVVQDEATAGQSIPVRLAGVTKVVANGAFAKGDLLAIAATTGKVDTTPGLDSSFDGATATAQIPLLIALEASAEADVIVEALIRPFYFPWG